MLLKEAADFANNTSSNSLAASSCSKSHGYSANGYSMYCGYGREQDSCHSCSTSTHQHINTKLWLMI